VARNPRHRPGNAKPSARAGELPPEAIELRYRWLGRWLMASEPETEAAGLSEKIRAKIDALDAADLTPLDRLTKLEAFLADLGQLETASHFADRIVWARLSPDAPRGTPLTR